MSRAKGNKPFGSMITQLCLKVGVKRLESNTMRPPKRGPIRSVGERKSLTMLRANGSKGKSRATPSITTAPTSRATVNQRVSKLESTTEEEEKERDDEEGDASD